MKIKEPAASYQTRHKPFTYKDYELLPDDGQRHQVIQGELIMTPAPLTKHQEVIVDILFEILQFNKKKHLGKVYTELDIKFDDFNVVRPDIVFVANENLHIIGEKNIQGAPDLIVEVLSPSTAFYDQNEKKDIYSQFGVKEYWIVDPKQEWIEVFENQNQSLESRMKVTQKGEITSTILPNFSLHLEAIFSDR